MTKQQSSYRQILKVTSIFGGVQFINIIIQIVRSKAIALFLGPAGMGINSLLNSTVSIIANLSNFGLQTSAVKNISESNILGEKHVSKTISIVEKLTFVTGLLGLVIMLILAPWLSQLAFGSNDYTFGFVYISITLLVNQLSLGQLAVLQGLRKVNYLAKASLTGALLGLFISVPLYYFFETDGIVPAIILISFSNALRSWYFRKKVNIQKVSIHNSHVLKDGKQMLILGFSLSISGFLTIASSYVLRLYISNTSSIVSVGLYSAGFTMVETYVGLVFNAMGTDYFPRLSAVNKNIKELRKVVTQQAIIALLIIIPIISIFVAFSPLIIDVLYSSNFSPIYEMVKWAVVGMFFRALSWSMGYIILSRGDSKLFIKTSIAFNSLFLINNIVCFSQWGLKGIGYAFLSNYIVHFISLFFITKHYYKFYFLKDIKPIFLTGIALSCLSLFSSYLQPYFLKYVLSFIVCLISIVYSALLLNKKTNLLNPLLNRFYDIFK